MIDELEKQILVNEEPLHFDDFNILFQKDSSGKTLLEFILANNKELDYHNEVQISNNPFAYYLYLKYQNPAIYFNLTEDFLFTEIEGKSLIEYALIFKKSMYSSLKVIKNHPELIDMICKYDPYNLPYISDELINYLITSQNDTYPLEKYINEKNIKGVIQRINDGNVLFKLYQKTNNKIFIENANSKALLFKYNNDETILDYIIKNNLEHISFKSLSYSDDKELIDYIINSKRFDLIKDVNEKLLLEKIDGNKTLLEVLIENKVNNIIINVYRSEAIKILLKYNKLNYINSIDNSALILNSMKDYGIDKDECLYDYLKENHINISLNSYAIGRDPQAIKFLCDRGEYKFLSTINSLELLKPLPSGKSIFEEILINYGNIDNLGYSFVKEEEVAKLLVKYRKYELLAKMDLKILFKSYLGINSYLSILLSGIRNNQLKILLNNVDKTDPKLYADFLLKLAKEDMMSYVFINKDTLFKGSSKCVIDYLLEQNPQLTIESIIPRDVKKLPAVAAKIKEYGFELEDLEFEIQDKKYEDLLHNEFTNHVKGPLNYDDYSLVKELNDLFINDNQSDKKVVGAFINGYINGLYNEHDLIVEEIKKLISIKRANMDKFCFYKGNDGSYFKPLTGAIYVNNIVDNTLMHEVGHALHYYLDDFRFPKNYFDIIKRTSEDPKRLEQVKEYANEYAKICNMLREESEKQCEKYFENYYTKERIDEIENFIQQDKVSKINELIKNGIEEEKAKELVDKIVTVDEFIKHKKKVYIFEYIDQRIRNEYSSYMIIGDILDAIYRGELFSRIKKMPNGESLEKVAGHGINYYYRDSHGFDEILANFEELIKVNNSKTIAKTLRNLVGEEVFTMILKYYYGNILKNPKYTYEQVEEEYKLNTR